MDETDATLESQFKAFGSMVNRKMHEEPRSGETITLFRSDYWMRQANVLDDRTLRMTDTGICFFKFSKSELNFDEWSEMLSDLCMIKDLDEEAVKEALTNCGLPGQVHVSVPKYSNFFKTYVNPKALIDRQMYCNATFDGYLCWPPTLAGENSEQNCPSMRLSDPSQFAYRRCGFDGRWLGRYDNEYSLNGWTNYTPCFPPVVRSLFFKVYEEDDDSAQVKFSVAGNTRGIEIVGFSLSFILLTISLYILHSYPTLHNLRTLIHKNLFLSMNAQVVVRLIVYIDQALMRWNADDPNSTGLSAIEKIPHLCIAMYIILENLNTSMFIWMLNEGIYLNTLVTSNVMRGNNWYKYYWIGGWVFPVILTGIWVLVSAYDYSDDDFQRCWYGYNFRAYYWVLQAPRFAVIMINFCFLGNIIRVLIMKLRQDNSSEVVMVRKAVKATAVLLPLLGITNILSMFEGPIEGPVWAFASHSYVTHFARSFQGAFLAILYCFLNGEVNALLAKSMSNRVTIMRHRYPTMTRVFRWRPRRREPEAPAGSNRPALRPGDIPLRANPLWTPRSQMPETDSNTANVSETEFGGTSAERRSNSPVAQCSQTTVDIETPRGAAALQYLPRRRSNSPVAQSSQTTVDIETPRGVAALQYLPSHDM